MVKFKIDFYAVMLLASLSKKNTIFTGDIMVAPLYEKTLKYSKKNIFQFNIPGHNRGTGLPTQFQLMGSELLKMDFTEIPGLDDLHNPGGVIASAQKLTASLYGAKESYFLVNGTSCGLQALIMSLAREEEHILIPRNAHRAVVSGLILSGARPVFLYPNIMPFFNFPAGINLNELKKKLRDYPDCKAALLVHPTYYGTVSDLNRLVNKIHAAGLPAIIDEAHGTHLYFNRNFPPGALTCGADAVVQSVHKTGGSLTQSSWLHLKGERVNSNRVKNTLNLLQTTSPSYILMSSLDAAREQLENSGHKIMDRVFEYSCYARKAVSKIEGLTVLNKGFLQRAAWGLDSSRIVISVKGIGLTGYQAKNILSEHYKIEIEMADFNNIIAIIGPGTAKEDIDVLAAALHDLAYNAYQNKECSLLDISPPPIPPMRAVPRRAWMSESFPVILDEASGLVSAEMVCVYPPGIPVLYPGEEITEEIKDYLVDVRKLGLHCQGPEDNNLKYIRVI
ncbi:MAG: decarboxylase [Clostridiales bacterium]|nr:decarboxylase [Clostridiales bacterium]MCF8021536.1 decarboxylase [Clostridiales bacterium]